MHNEAPLMRHPLAQKVDRFEFVTHGGPPPRLWDGGEVGVIDVMLHSVDHGWEHEYSNTDEEQ